jgi:hypothetical protein
MASVSGRRLDGRLRSATRAGIMAFAASATILVAMPASAGCGLLDPGCLQTTARDTLGTATGTVEDQAGTVNGPVDDPVGTVTGPAGGIVDQVGDTVDGLLGQGPQDPPYGGGGGGDPMPRPGGGGPRDGPAGRPLHAPARAPSRATGLSPSGAMNVDAPGSELETPSGDQNGGLLGQIAGTASGVARRLGFPIALALLVLVFAVLQNRLDRNDPRMARAPVVPDVLRFG